MPARLLRKPARPPDLRPRSRVRFHRPRKSPRFFAGLAVLALGLVLAVDSFSRPANRAEQAQAYTNTGEFSYTAQVARPDPVVYPNGVAETGQPLVIGDIDQASVSFTYHFRSQLSHELHGTIGLQVVFLGDSGWRNAYKLVSPVPFSGDDASTTGTLSLPTLGQLLAKLQAGSARAARAYTVYLQPVVQYEGAVAGRSIHGTFDPSLPFMLDAAVFAPQALNLSNPAEQTQRLAAELHPSETGELSRSVVNVISFLGLHASVLVFRAVACILVALGLFVAFRSQRRRRDDVWSHEKRVAFRAGRSLVEVRDLEATLPPGSVVTDVVGYDDLVLLAAQTDRPILREARLGGELFGVDLPPRLYLWRKPLPVAIPDAPPAVAESGPAAPPVAPPTAAVLKSRLRS